MNNNFTPIPFKAQISINEIRSYDDGVRTTTYELLLLLDRPHLSNTTLFSSPHKNKKGFKDIPSDWVYDFENDVHAYCFKLDKYPADEVVDKFIIDMEELVQSLYLIECHKNILCKLFDYNLFDVNRVTTHGNEQHFKTPKGSLYISELIDGHIYFKGKQPK
jgi:hypothetical protein